VTVSKEQRQEYRAEAREAALKALDELVPLGMAIKAAGLRASRYTARYKTMDSPQAKKLWKIYDDLNDKAAEASSAVRFTLNYDKWFSGNDHVVVSPNGLLVESDPPSR
jgi:hypothetical protein